MYEPLHESSYEGIARVKDEVYGPAERNRLDIYFPLNDKREKIPVILFVHGGGFFSGGKEWSEKVCSFCDKPYREYMTDRLR